MTFAQPFANYEILARVGAGSMGTVFKARQKHLDRIVALKVLKPALARDARFVERLEREGRTVARLSHPNIVIAYDLGHEGGYHYLVMEFVEGKSLRQLLGEWGRFPEKQVVQLAREMAGALAHAHDCGVTHRDIKPANILIDGDGRAKLTDLGLARAETDLALTRDGATVGTPQYISPEQARNPREADIRSDLYSLGATLFHMLTGQPPFRADAIGELIDKVLHERPDSVVDLVADVSEGLSLVIRKLLAKDPSLRYQTPRELLADLDRIERSEPPEVDVDSLSNDRSPNDRPPRVDGRRSRRNSWVWNTAVVCLGALLGAGGLLLWQGLTRAAKQSRIEADLALAPTMRDRFAVLDRYGAGAMGEDAAVVAALRAATIADMEREVLDEVRTVRGPDDRELGATLARDPSVRDGGEFVRRIVVPRLVERTGYRPEALPDAALRSTTQRALALLREAADTEAMRVRNLALDRLSRFLDSTLRPQCLAMARDGRPQSALQRFDEDIARQVELEASQGQVLAAAELSRVVDSPRAALRAEILAIQGEVSAAASERFLDLRRRYEEEVGVLERERPVARLLHDATARVTWAIHASIPARSELLSDGVSPWPAIDAWSVASRQRIDGLEVRWAEATAQATLSLAYAVWAAHGGRAAHTILSTVFDSADTTSVRIHRHAAMFTAFDGLARRAIDRLLAGKSVARLLIRVNGQEREVELSRSPEGAIACLSPADGADVPIASLVLDDLFERAKLSTSDAELQDDDARLARALSLHWNRQGARSTAIVDPTGANRELLAFFLEECVPLVRSVRDAGLGDDSELRIALQDVASARQRGDVDAVEQLIATIEARHPPEQIAHARELLREARAWVQLSRLRTRPLADLVARSPTAAEVSLLDDGTERVAIGVGNLVAASFHAGWQRESGVARFLPGDNLELRGSLRDPLITASFPSPFRADIARLVVDLEFQMTTAESELRILLVEVHGVLIALAVLPSGEVRAAAAPASAAAGEQLRATLSRTLFDAAGSETSIIADVWHELRIVTTKRDGAISLRVELDGQDRAPLLEWSASSLVASTPRIGFGALSPIGLRRLVLSHSP